MASLDFLPLRYSSLPHHAIPFDQISPEMYLPALRASLKSAKSEIERIRDQDGAPTLENTIVALETAGEEADLVSGTFYNLLHAHTNETLQKLALEIGPLLANHASDILLDAKLFSRIRSLYEKRSTLGLNVEQAKLIA